MKNIIAKYINQLNQIYATDNYTEHSFRGAFAELCHSVLNYESTSKKKELYGVINEPKRKDYGAPDYEITMSDTTLSFVEAKNIGDSDLRGQKASQNKKQFDRYKAAISTIAFTDYLSIILYIDGEEKLAGCIGTEIDGAIVLNENSEEVNNFIKTIKLLGSNNPQPVRSAKNLAAKMAHKAKLVADILHKAMSRPNELQTELDKDLWGKLKTYKEYLVHDMTASQFVDFYAQTVLYGMLVARIYDATPEKFSLVEAAELIPSSNPFLKRIFRDLALANPHPYIKGILEDLVLLFKATKMDKILRSYKKDPLVHFYEDFLEAYNPKIKDDFGVWYTPSEVVKFIVDSVDEVLIDDFGIEAGLANNELLDTGKHRVQILDPATGTGTFLAVTAEKIYEKYKGQEGLWNDDVPRHIIPRLNGFEYLVAPYTMAHIKLAMALKLESIKDIPDRLNIFLTNSLEEDHPEARFDFARYITDESNAASQIKRDTPIMVIMGNPPYNENSANTGKWIMDLMSDYKQEPGMSRIETHTKRGRTKYKNTLKERNAKGINNDYCKFIRLGHNFLSRTPEGVLAYICGNTFLTTNIFRGMRYRLLQDFDEIYVINLHGSSKFDESQGSLKDENVFNIMVGVSINIFIKKKDSTNEGLAKVFYKDIYGSRKQKLEYLTTHKLKDIDFKAITPCPPFYELSIKDDNHEALKEQYESGFRLNDMMPMTNQGFKTGRDPIVICNSKQQLGSLISDLVSDSTDETLVNTYGFRDSRDWNLSSARRSLKMNRQRERFISRVCYRPFDEKWTYLHKDIVTYPRPLVQSSMLGKENLMLCVGKQGTALGNNEWSLVWLSDLPTDMNINPRGGAYLFPLYIYEEGYSGRSFNLHSTIIERFENTINLRLQPENAQQREDGGFLAVDLIDYIYAVLNSKAYRKKYHQFLQNDFPVVPYPTDAEYFFKIAGYGAQLRSLHLLNNITQSNFITRYPVTEGDDVVTERRFEPDGTGKGKVWINNHRYFDDVPEKAWEFVVSGYQPLDKWLKDRNGTSLGSDDIRHYQKMVLALTRTIDVVAEIDTFIQL